MAAARPAPPQPPRPRLSRLFAPAGACAGRVVLSACLAALVPAAAGAQSATPAPSEALALLAKVQAAARELDYAGVYVHQQGTVLQSSHIVHVVDGTGERERIETLEGSPLEYLRHNEATQCLIPDQKLVVRERHRTDRFPALYLGDGKNIASHYDIQVFKEPRRVAGRACQLIELRPRDEWRYGYKLCADLETHLLLRSQTIAAGEGVVEQVAFGSLQVGKQVAGAQLESRWKTDDWRVIELGTPRPIDLAASGWRIPLPDGFRVLTQVARQLPANREVAQLVVSDELAVISVFIEAVSGGAGGADVVGPEATLHQGATHVLRRRVGDYWLTALGEVPAETLRRMAALTQYVPGPTDGPDPS